MVYTVSPDVLLTCPLDESHRILKSRMQFHLVRCLKNHKLDMKIKCPWNPLHIVEKFRYEEHFTNCEDMPSAMQYLVPSEGCKNVASVPLSAYKSVVPPSEEDWDAEPPVGTYDPLKNTADRPILKVSVGGSKARKKQFRLEERRRHQALEDTAPIQTTATTLRPPRKLSLAVSADNSLAEELNSCKISKDDQKTPVTKKSGLLRMPHEPSPAMLDFVNTTKASPTPNLAVKTNGNDYSKAVANGAMKKDTTDDELLARKDLESVAVADSKSAKTKRKEATSRKTSESYMADADSNIEAVRKMLLKESDKAKEAAAAEKNRMKNDVSNIEKSVGEYNKNAIDEAASNDLEAYGIADSSVNEPEEEINQLSQRLASLTNIEKTILKEKTAILAQMTQLTLVPKLINPESANTSMDKCPDLVDGAPDDDDSSPPPLTIPDPLPIVESSKSNGGIPFKESALSAERQNGYSHALSRCAANFAKSASPIDSPLIGAGRGIISEYEAFRNTRPGGKHNPPETRPKINRKFGVENNHSHLNFGPAMLQRKVTPNNTISDEVGSVYGYEEADD